MRNCFAKAMMNENNERGSQDSSNASIVCDVIKAGDRLSLRREGTARRWVLM
jgi:hypothetical protein